LERLEIHVPARARKTGFDEANQSDLPSPVLFEKIFRFSASPNQIDIPPSRPERGAFRDRHGRWVRDAVDALARQDERTKADGEVVWS